MENNIISIRLLFAISLIIPLHALPQVCRFYWEAMQGIDDLHYYIKEEVDEFNLLSTTRLLE